MITPQDPPKELDPGTLDEMSPGFGFDAHMRHQGRVAALDSAARSMAGTKLATDPHEVLAHAEVFESWLLRPPSS